MTKLSLTVPLHPDETSASFCCRLAARNGRDAQSFCLDMGFRFQSIVTGDETALAKLAAVSGADLHTLRRNSFTKVDVRVFKVRDQLVSAIMSSRNRVRVCPDCVAEDVASSLGRPGVPIQRIYWQLLWFRSCQVHGVALVTIDYANNMMGCADFARVVGPFVKQMQMDASSISKVVKSPSRMETYLYRKLNGDVDAALEWLESVPLYKFARLCEVVGAVSRFGPKVAVRDLDDETVLDVETVGCDILLGGEDSFREFVRRAMSGFWKDSGEPGARRYFGLLYEWLMEEREERTLDPVRSAIREEMAEALPVAASHMVFDVSIGHRRCWSVTTIATDLTITSSRMRQYFAARGLITAEHEGLSNDRITFPVARIKPLVDQLRSMVTQKEAVAYFGIPTCRFLALMREGLIVPFFSRLEAGFFCNGFLKADLDGFLEKLSKSVTMPVAEEGMVEVFEAARRCRAPYAHLMRILLDGTLSRVAPWHGEGGRCSLAVDPVEVRQVLAKQVPGEDQAAWPYLSVEQVREQTKWGNGATWTLISKGFLPHQVMTNPVTTRKCAFVHRDELASFRRKYVTFGEAAREMGTGYVREILRQGRVRPAIKPGVGEVAFYLRSDFKVS